MLCLILSGFPKLAWVTDTVSGQKYKSQYSNKNVTV